MNDHFGGQGGPSLAQRLRQQLNHQLRLVKTATANYRTAQRLQQRADTAWDDYAASRTACEEADLSPADLLDSGLPPPPSKEPTPARRRKPRTPPPPPTPVQDGSDSRDSAGLWPEAGQ